MSNKQNTKGKDAPADEKAVAKVQQGGAMAVPDFMKQHAGLGAEAISNDALEIPRIKLIQAISPEVETHGMTPGDWFHTVGEVSLEQELSVIPIKLWTSVILWAPRSDGGGILARAEDGVNWDRPNEEFTVRLKNNKVVHYNTRANVAASGLLDYGTSNPEDKSSAPAATRNLNFLLWLPDYPEMSPSVMSFARAGEKIGRRFMTKLKMMSANVPIFGKHFTLSSERVSGPEGDYLLPRVIDGDFVQDQDLFNKLLDMHRSFSDKVIRTKGDSQEEGAASGGVSDEEAAGRSTY